MKNANADEMVHKLCEFIGFPSKEYRLVTTPVLKNGEVHVVLEKNGQDCFIFECSLFSKERTWCMVMEDLLNRRRTAYGHYNERFIPITLSCLPGMPGSGTC